jgi:hypothetical protein
MMRRILALAALVAGLGTVTAACGDPSDLVGGNAFGVINVFGVVETAGGDPVPFADVVGTGYFDQGCRGNPGSNFTVATTTTLGTYEGTAGIGPVLPEDLPVEGCIKLYAFPPQGSTLGYDSIYLDSLVLDDYLAVDADTVEVDFILP